MSYKIDFANEWFGIPCSEEYWKAVRPVFNMLEVEKAKGTKWSALSNKEDDVYVPLLQAFMNEVQQAYRANKDVPRKMVEYLIGICDYYKVVSIDKKRLTLVHTFNLHGTLNQPSGDHEPSICVPVVELPTEIICARFKPKSKNTVEIYLDNGWELSFRIHSASTIVEKSLKFDIQFIGMPVSVLSINCQWH